MCLHLILSSILNVFCYDRRQRSVFFKGKLKVLNCTFLHEFCFTGKFLLKLKNKMEKIINNTVEAVCNYYIVESVQLIFFFFDTMIITLEGYFISISSK